MAIIHNTLKMEIYPTVPEICSVINAVLAFYPGQEQQVLQAVQTAIGKRLDELKENRKDETNG